MCKVKLQSPKMHHKRLNRRHLPDQPRVLTASPPGQRRGHTVGTLSLEARRKATGRSKNAERKWGRQRHSVSVQPLPHALTVFEFTVKAFGPSPAPFTLFEDDGTTFDFGNRRSQPLGVDLDPARRWKSRTHGIVSRAALSCRALRASAQAANDPARVRREPGPPPPCRLGSPRDPARACRPTRPRLHAATMRQPRGNHAAITG